MAIPNRKQLPTSDSNLRWVITDDGSRTLLDAGINETYHSGCGAVAESLVVYLKNSGVYERLLSGRATTVLEYGFGTATAFFLSAALARSTNTDLHYIGLEKRLLPADILEALNIVPAFEQAIAGQSGLSLSDVPDFRRTLQTVVDEYLLLRSQLPEDVIGRHVLKFRDDLKLELWVDDARAFPFATCPAIDAIYFDPFSPESNPELWTEVVFDDLFRSLADSGTLTSYCVKGSVRRALAGVGFKVEKLPGPLGGKREVLLASKPAVTK